MREKLPSPLRAAVEHIQKAMAPFMFVFSRPFKLVIYALVIFLAYLWLPSTKGVPMTDTVADWIGWFLSHVDSGAGKVIITVTLLGALIVAMRAVMHGQEEETKKRRSEQKSFEQALNDERERMARQIGGNVKASIAEVLSQTENQRMFAHWSAVAITAQEYYKQLGKYEDEIVQSAKQAHEKGSGSKRFRDTWAMANDAARDYVTALDLAIPQPPSQTILAIEHPEFDALSAGVKLKAQTSIAIVRIAREVLKKKISRGFREI